MLVPLETHGNARDPEEGPFDRRCDGPRIEDVDPGIEAAVDPADDDIGPTREELRDPQLDGVGRAAVDGPSAQARAIEDLLGRQRGQEGDCMPDPALFGRGGDGNNVAQPPQGTLHRGQSGGKDPIVIRQQREHRNSSGGLECASDRAPIVLGSGRRHRGRRLVCSPPEGAEPCISSPVGTTAGRRPILSGFSAPAPCGPQP